MKNPNIKTRVVHSQSKPAWNIVGETLGGKYKIARVPYLVLECDTLTQRNRQEAFEHANFISHCFNNADAFYKITLEDIKSELEPLEWYGQQAIPYRPHLYWTARDEFHHEYTVAPVYLNDVFCGFRLSIMLCVYDNAEQMPEPAHTPPDLFSSDELAQAAAFDFYSSKVQSLYKS